MWTKDQKITAASASKNAGLSDEERKMILSGPAFAHRAIHEGRPTSTSPRLTNQDFEEFMAFVEMRTPGRQIKGFAVDHFTRKADDPNQRIRRKIEAMAAVLEATEKVRHAPQLVGIKEVPEMLLAPRGVGLAGWIRARVARGRTDKLEELDRHELVELVEGLKAYGRRHGIVWADEAPVTTQMPKGGEREAREAREKTKKTLLHPSHTLPPSTSIDSGDVAVVGHVPF